MTSNPPRTTDRVSVTAFLPLVGHVVNQLGSRYPRHVDRRVMWTLGAWGLVAAFRHGDPADPAFTSRTVRTIRAHIVDATRVGAETPTDPDGDVAQLAAEMGIDPQRLQNLRDAAVPAAPTGRSSPAAPAEPRELPVRSPQKQRGSRTVAQIAAAYARTGS